MRQIGVRACYGGSRNNGANAGLGALNLNNPASNANSNIGARLANDTGGQKPGLPRQPGQRPSFGARILSIPLKDQQPRAASSPSTVARGARFDMPKTHTGLFDRIIAFDNLVAAYEEARRGKRYTPEALAFATRWEEQLINTHEHLVWHSWHPGSPRVFTVKDPKRRDITAPPFADRIVHHALVRVVEPLFERRFIADSYACRVGKGSHAAVVRAQDFLRRAKRNWGDGIYLVHADVRSYFASIDHDVAIACIRRVIADEDVLWLWRRIMHGYGFDGGVGLPVGALTSQLVANIVLDQVDHAIKDDAGEPYYLRYMDDMVAVCRDKAHARQTLERIADACARLKLRLNPKSRYEPWQRGLDFCGYRVWPTHVLPRKRNTKRWRQRLRRLVADYAAGRATLADARQMIASCIAYYNHASARHTLGGLLSQAALRRGKSTARIPRDESRHL